LGQHKAAALKATAALRTEINRNGRSKLRAKALTVAELINQYRQRELATEKRVWIEPRWGSSSLNTVRAVEVEMWLGTLPLARGSRAKIRNLMSFVFNHGRRHGFIDRNPISLVRQSAKRQTVPDVLLPSEINRLLQGCTTESGKRRLFSSGKRLLYTLSNARASRALYRTLRRRNVKE